MCLLKEHALSALNDGLGLVECKNVRCKTKERKTGKENDAFRIIDAYPLVQ